MIYTYQHNGQAYTINLEPQPDGGYTATLGDRTYWVEAVLLADGGWRLGIQTSPLPPSPSPLHGEGEKSQYYQKPPEGVGRKNETVYTAAQGNKRFVSLGGQNYTLSVPDARTSRRRATGGGGDLTAQMPGQVASVLIQEGDAVERGQALVILEAMKMEIRVTAPGRGRIKRLLVQAGQVVERGQLLLEIEENSSL